jgi:hypothetical protein
VNLAFYDTDFVILMKRAGHPEISVTNQPSSINVRLKVGPVPVSLYLSMSVEAGNLVINITKATAAGLDLFGLVRSKAEAQITSILSAYGTVTKNSDGNLLFQNRHFSWLRVSSTPVKLMASIVLSGALP